MNDQDLTRFKENYKYENEALPIVEELNDVISFSGHYFWNR